jgi:hypothetical protein
MGNIIFEKLEQYDSFMEVEVTGISKFACVNTRVYIADEHLSVLASLVQQFCYDTSSHFYWENGEKGDRTTTSVSLEFVHKDTLGHIVVELYMELDDGGSLNKHNCCFYVETELGLLERFGQRLGVLKHQHNGERIALDEHL